MAKDKICEVCGGDYRVSKYGKTNQYLCNKHRHQIERYGEIKERTIKDKNEVMLYDDYAEIILYNRNCEEIARAIISLDDVEKCKEYKWHINCMGYVETHINKKTILLHKFLMNTEESFIVDHQDRNPLNNHRNNLRQANSQENAMNRSIQSNNTSGVVGVTWFKRVQKWRAYIKINRKQIHLGYYDDLDEAIKVRKDAEEKYFGEFAPKQEVS